MKSKEDIFYEAMLARDHRFDGKFFVGVKTTGIYCRPICPAKPKRENVEFFGDFLSAEKAGYRPCMRCRPESAPLSGAWLGKSAMVQRAVKIINQQETISFNEDHFADLFGVSSRHLRRVFTQEIGKTPKQLAFENRLNVARKLILETSLPLTQIAFASGFESIRRFNSAFKERFKQNPSEIRRAKPKKSSALKVSLSYRPPYDFEGLMQSYKNHRVGNLERFEEGKMIRVIFFDRKVGEITISHLPDESSVQVEIDFPDTSFIHIILAKVRILFDLDSDPILISNSMEKHDGLKKLLMKHQGIRLPSGWDPFEVTVATILGQFVSVDFGRTLVADLIEMLGEESGLEMDGKPIKLFPSPKKIAQADLTKLKTTEIRKETLKLFAHAVATKKISLEPTQDIENFYQSVRKIKGIGPWTASYMALKAIRHTDAFPDTDLILKRALVKYPLAVINQMSPWRGYAAALIWKEK